MRIIIILNLIFLYGLSNSYAQKPRDIEFGASINLTYSFLGKKTSGNFSLGAAIGISTLLLEEKDIRLRPGYQIAVNIYNNGLGTSLADKQRKRDGAQIDLINSIVLIGGIGNLSDRDSSFNRARLFNHMTAAAIENQVSWATVTGAYNIIFNNNHRNQHLWFAGVDAVDVLRVGFYNDGPPFAKVGFGDTYDRWWTGGGFIELDLEGIHKLAKGVYGERDEEEPFEYTTPGYLFQSTLFYNFDRFTGDNQDAYELANYLAINYFESEPTNGYVDYNQQFYNQGQTLFGYKHKNGWGLGANFLGQWRRIDIQDFIHDKMAVSHHFSYARKNLLLDIYYDTSLFDFPKFKRQ